MIGAYKKEWGLNPWCLLTLWFSKTIFIFDKLNSKGHIKYGFQVGYPIFFKLKKSTFETPLFIEELKKLKNAKGGTQEFKKRLLKPLWLQAFKGCFCSKSLKI